MKRKAHVMFDVLLWIGVSLIIVGVVPLYIAGRWIGEFARTLYALKILGVCYLCDAIALAVVVTATMFFRNPWTPLEYIAVLVFAFFGIGGIYMSNKPEDVTSDSEAKSTS